MTESEEKPKKASPWPSVLILAFGILVTVYAFSAMRNDVPITFWGLAWIVGPLFVLIGGGAIVRSR